MIIFGKTRRLVATNAIFDTCESCHKQGNMEMLVFKDYAHIFWIPFFPIGTKGISQCGHCKHALELKQMPGSLKLTYQNLKAQAKTPVWMYSGLMLVAVLIFIGAIAGGKKNEKNAKLIVTPASGDVYEIKTRDRQYTLYKIDEVVGDSVVLKVSKYETDKLTGIYKIKAKGDAAYADDMFIVAKTQLKEMLEKNEIIDIDRK